ncbi:hypothetical protein BCR44DRAFT_25998 [Catenaria anguillulae PL171]|uniref:Uncharacterized protein n=1 Tax=Catenaria anguillulae PL171 TaxID=765915 RepID=A0A1Y2HZW2_9FUNG|nr:hypothetical protein BCR44DRAFT_25998 [Catenaria anguillulae PL171]
MSPASKLLLLRPALLQVPATLQRTPRPLASLPLARALLLRAPPVASVVVGTATAIVTEKIASKLVDKVADEAATKAVETAKSAVATMTGLDLESESDKDAQEEVGSGASKAHTLSKPTSSAKDSLARMGQRRSISTRTSINVTPQKNQQPYDYKPISDIDSIADAIGPESTRDARNDMHSAAAESSTKVATDRHLEAARTNPTGTEESQQLKETVKGFAGSVAADTKDVWKDAKNELGEAVDLTKDMLQDTARSIKGTVGKVLGAGMGDATELAENSQSMFTTGADIVGNKADAGKEMAKDTANSAKAKAHDAYAATKGTAQDASSTVADKVTDSYTPVKDKAQDVYASAADRAKATADKAQDMYSHAADRAEDALHASRAKAAQVAQDALGTAAGMADNARAMGHEAIDKTKAKTAEVKDQVVGVAHNMTGQAKLAAEEVEDKYHEAKAGAKGAAEGYAAEVAGKSAIERAKEAALGGGGGREPGSMAGIDDLPIGHTMNDYLDEAEDRLRGGDVRRRRSKL